MGAHAVFVEIPTELHARTAKHFVWTDVGYMNLYSALVIRHRRVSWASRVAERVTQTSRETCSLPLRRGPRHRKMASEIRGTQGSDRNPHVLYHSRLMAVRGAQ
jgi:hypothetical protein